MSMSATFDPGPRFRMETVDSSGNLYVADTDKRHHIRKIDTNSHDIGRLSMLVLKPCRFTVTLEFTSYGK